ncbi:zinc knuckle [Colletotrichum incanum]|uniref:Zinc knuckle n=1 Tax=Colletotrichum incanum TaxID=1573173 RepID=A0A161WCZ1_COLIC|nr:zinc knuckle [Colletotrichum incanum]OHW99001.1 hypothetical protein CSPAE12_02391 [Colletotrichum incanum]
MYGAFRATSFLALNVEIERLNKNYALSKAIAQDINRSGINGYIGAAAVRHRNSKNKDLKRRSDRSPPTRGSRVTKTPTRQPKKPQDRDRTAKRALRQTYYSLHEGLSKRQSLILVQIRTEKIRLKDFLFNRRVPDATDANCLYREGRQTELKSIPGRHNLRAVLNKRKAAAKAIRFIEQTEILR